MTTSKPFRDVRLRGFSQRTPLDTVQYWIDARTVTLASETVQSDHAAGRILSIDLIAEHPLPDADRAVLDGYALHSIDTLGASDYQPLLLQLLDTAQLLSPGQAIAINSGERLPANADAVLAVEHARQQGAQLLITDSVASGSHIVPHGRDVAAGDTLLPAGRRLRPQDIGLLALQGMMEISVVRQPRVAIYVTGYQPDANGPMLSALVRRDGARSAIPVVISSATDLHTVLENTEADVVLIAGGCSVGATDFVPSVLADCGELTFHGIALQPAGAAGVGYVDKTPVFLLPGNPAACLCAYDLLAGRSIRRLGGTDSHLPYRQCKAVTQRKLISTLGQVDYWRVSLTDAGVYPLALNATAMYSISQADGFLLIPSDSEGYPPNTEIDVYCYD